MLYLMTGVPGSGKSLRAVYYIEQWQQEGRKVYTNIDGLALEHEPLPDDWRDTVEGAVIVYDEAQEVFPSTGRAGPSQSEQVRAMEKHRHTGHDLLFITQHPTMVDVHIRKLVGQHEHLERTFGAAAAAIHAWPRTGDPSDHHEKQKADRFTWRFPRRLYKAYKSATVHTHKFRVPKKLVAIFAVIAVIFALAWWNFQSITLFENEPAMPPPGPADEPVAEQQHANLQPVEGQQEPELRRASFYGDPPDTLDGRELSRDLRYTGNDGRCAYLHSRRGDLVVCPGGEFRLIEMTRYTAVIQTPFGHRYLVTAHDGPTPPEVGHASQQDWYQEGQRHVERADDRER